jgi:hypothetical protein
MTEMGYFLTGLAICSFVVLDVIIGSENDILGRKSA